MMSTHPAQRTIPAKRTHPARMRVSVAALCLLVAGLAGTAAAFAQAGPADSSAEAQAVLNNMLAHENEATGLRGRYVYMSEERSDRTGGHLWKERVAETDWGKVHFLIAEDGRPLTGDRLSAEKARIEDEGRNPEDFRKQEQSRADEEQHARQMLTLLPKAFLFNAPRTEGEVIKFDYRPNPAYQPQSMEEKVMHAMSGTVQVDAKMLRLREVDGHIAQDLSLSFGLASIKAGSNFMTVREHVDGPDWKTDTVHTDIRGKALFLKTIVRQGESKHTDFKRIPNNTSVAAAVAMLERD